MNYLQALQKVRDAEKQLSIAKKLFESVPYLDIVHEAYELHHDVANYLTFKDAIIRVLTRRIKQDSSVATVLQDERVVYGVFDAAGVNGLSVTDVRAVVNSAKNQGIK